MIGNSYVQVPITGEYGNPAPPVKQRSYRPFYWQRKLWCIHHTKPDDGGLFSDIKTIYRSADGGQTWVKVKELPQAADTSFRMEFWVDQINEYLQICYYNADNNLEIKRFNCNVQDFDATWTSSGITGSFTVYDFFARTDGKFVVCARYGTMPQYIIVDPSAVDPVPVWGAMTEIPLPFIGSLYFWCLGANNRLHLIAIQELTPANKVWHMNVAADGTAAGIQTVDTDFGFEFFSNMVPFKAGSDTYIMIWGRYRGDEEFTMRAASLHAKSEAAPTWTKTDTWIPPNNNDYDLTAIGDVVLAVSATSDFLGGEYIKFRNGKWDDQPTRFWHDDTRSFFYHHGNNLNGEYGVVFRSNDKFYHFLVVPNDKFDACYQQVFLPPVKEMDPVESATWVGEGKIRQSEHLVNGPWRVAADALYMTGYSDTYMDWMHVFRSKDNGRSWEVQDAANAGPFFGVPAWNPATKKITLLFYAKVNPTTPGEQSLAMKDFDTATNTWGPVYATVGGPKDPTIYALVIKPNGQKVAFFSDSWDMAYYPTTYQWYFSVWTLAGGWTTPVRYTDNNTDTDNDEILFGGATLDEATGNIHLTWQYSAAWGGAKSFYHRVLNDDLTLGTASLIVQNTLSGPREESDFSVGPPTVIFKDKVYVMFKMGWKDKYTTPTSGYYYMMVGDPKDAPATWTKRKVATLRVTDVPGNMPDEMDMTAVVKGDKLIFLYNDLTGPSGVSGDYSGKYGGVMRVYRIETSDGVAWSMPKLFFDMWGSSEGLYFSGATDIGTGMADGIGVFGHFVNGNAVTCGLYICRGGEAVNYAY